MTLTRTWPVIICVQPVWSDIHQHIDENECTRTGGVVWNQTSDMILHPIRNKIGEEIIDTTNRFFGFVGNTY